MSFAFEFFVETGEGYCRDKHESISYPLDVRSGWDQVDENFCNLATMLCRPGITCLIGAETQRIAGIPNSSRNRVVSSNRPISKTAAFLFTVNFERTEAGMRILGRSRRRNISEDHNQSGALNHSQVPDIVAKNVEPLQAPRQFLDWSKPAFALSGRISGPTSCRRSMLAFALSGQRNLHSVCMGTTVGGGGRAFERS